MFILLRGSRWAAQQLEGRTAGDYAAPGLWEGAPGLWGALKGGSRRGTRLRGAGADRSVPGEVGQASSAEPNQPSPMRRANQPTPEQAGQANQPAPNRIFLPMKTKTVAGESKKPARGPAQTVT